MAMFILILIVLSLKLISRIECLKPQSKVVVKLLFSIVNIVEEEGATDMFLDNDTMIVRCMMMCLSLFCRKIQKNSPDAFQDKILRPVIIKKLAKNLQF